MAFLHYLKEKYLLHMISSGSAEQCEEAMENFCSLMRAGHQIRNPKLMGRALVGRLFSPSERISRWSLNAIAHIGRRAGREFINAVQRSVLQHIEHPFMLRYAIAALFAVMQNDDEVFEWLNTNKVPLEVSAILASAPFSQKCRENINKLGINIESADNLTLQNASILVGVGEMPEGIFSGKHPYNTNIGQLNKHDDNLVRQYSIWAVKENPDLSVTDLTFNLWDIDSLAHDEKKWAYPTIAVDKECASKYRDILEAGSNDNHVDVRKKLASGLLNTYYIDIERLTFDWYANEDDPEIVLRLLEHMASQSDKSNDYKQTALDRFTALGKGSIERDRLQSAAARTTLFGDMQDIVLMPDPTFFVTKLTGEPTVTYNNINEINIEGGNSGDISVAQSNIGSARNTVNDIENIELKEILRELLDEIDKNNLSEDSELLENIECLAKQPNKTTAKKVLEYLKAYTTIANIPLVTAKLTEWANNLLGG